MRRVLLLPTLVLASIAAPAAGGHPGGTLPSPSSSIPAPLVTASPATLLAAIHAPGAAAVLVNVWATWCVPCREEMPDLLRLRRAYAERGLRVILVSGDFDSERAQAEAFLHELGVDFPTYFKSGDDAQFIDAFDPAWTGALPATFIYDAKGERRYSLFGKTSYAAFEEKVNNLLHESKPQSRGGRALPRPAARRAAGDADAEVRRHEFGSAEREGERACHED